MNTKYAFFAAVFAAAMVVSASETTSAMAAQAADSWAQANAEAFAPAGSALEPVAERDSNGSLLWWVVPFSGGGAVIVAPDTRIEPVIAALPKYSGELPSGHPLRAILTLDMKRRLSLVKAVAEATAGRVRLRSDGGDESAASPSADVVESANAAKTKWGELVPNGPVRLKVGYPSPITGVRDPAYVLGLCSGFEYGGVYTHWNQSYSPYSTEPDSDCYNYYTPRHAVCGCVATAGAAVMQFFGNTGPTYNATNTCSWGSEFIPESYSAPFTMIGATNAYDWSILPAFMGGEGELSDGMFTKEQVELLGRVTYDMGVGVKMAWAEDGVESGAYTYNLAAAFRSYYGFADARGAVNRKIESQEDEFFEGGSALYESICGERNRKFLYGQLRNNVPVPLGINDLVPVMGGGHAVVAVGYGLDKAGTSYTRIFMGWAGTGDAWYCLPQIDDFDFVAQYVTMIGKDDRKTVPIVGRVVTVSGAGAAFLDVQIGSITNVKTDANGYWATRIDETGLTIGDPEVVWSSCETNTDEEVIAAIDALGGSLSYTVKESATVGDANYEDAYAIDYELTNEDIEVELEDGSTSNYTAVVINSTCKARQYSVHVKCYGSDEVKDVKIGAVAFGSDKFRYEDELDDEAPENSNVSFSALLDSLPDEMEFSVPDDAALTAYPGTENPDTVAAAAAAAGKKMFILSGDPDKDEYKVVLDYLSSLGAVFTDNYVLYLVDPSVDPYTLADGNPSFGVFDPTIFNSQAPNRWAFYNGRLSYFDASNGVTYEDVQKVLDDGSYRYSKLHDNIKVTVRSDNCNLVNGMKVFGTNDEESKEKEKAYQGLISGLWGDGLPDDVEGFSADAVDWLGNDIVGQGVFTNAFRDGQGVTFTAPAAVTNNNVVWVPVGWRLSAEEEEEDLLDLYDLWANKSEEDWDAEFEGLLPKPEEFCPTDFGFLWIENDLSDPDSATEAPVLTARDDSLILTWLWEPREVYISTEAVNGTVTPESGWHTWSTNDEDVVVFNAEGSQPGAKFLGWTVDAKDEIMLFPDEELILRPVGSCSVKASFTLDTKYYRFTTTSDPSSISDNVAAVLGGKSLTLVSGGSFTGQPGYMVVSNLTESVEVDGQTLYCAGWVGTGSVPAHGTGNVCEFAFTEESTITWLWREEGWTDPYEDAAIKFTVDAGEGAPEGVFAPEVGVYEKAYTNGQIVVCQAASGVTNAEERIAVVCAGWTLVDNASGDEIASGEGSEAEITFESNADWTLAWAWQTNELVRIVVNVENGSSSAPDGLYLKGETVDVTVTGQNAYTFDHWEGDTNGCVFAGYSVGLGFTASIPADADRSLTAVLANRGAGVKKLSVISLLTNSVEGVVSDTNGVEGVYGKSAPVQERETTENFTAGGKVMLVMDDVAYTNVVDEVMVVWVCSGWKLFADDNEHTNLLAEGTGRAAEFTFTCDSKFVWVWTEQTKGRQRSPLPATLEGPNGAVPLVVEPGKTVAQIQNTAYGWWYGLYSKVSLTDPNEEWTLVPGKVQLQTDDDDVLITLEVEWDPAEPVKFFRVIVTEDDPR